MLNLTRSKIIPKRNIMKIYFISTIKQWTHKHWVQFEVVLPENIWNQKKRNGKNWATKQRQNIKSHCYRRSFFYVFAFHSIFQHFEFSLKKMLFIYLWFFLKRKEKGKNNNNNVNRLLFTVDYNFGTIESNQKLLTSPLMFTRSQNPHTHTSHARTHTHVYPYRTHRLRNHTSAILHGYYRQCERNLLQFKWLWLYLRMPLSHSKNEMKWCYKHEPYAPSLSLCVSVSISLAKRWKAALLALFWKFIKCRTEGM